MRYTKLRTWFILLAVVACVIIVLNYAGTERGVFKSANPVTDSLITATYPDLYRAVESRSAGRLEPFLSHQSAEVREQAWRALASTPVDSLSDVLELAIEQNSEAAWFGISQHRLAEGQLRMLERRWESDTAYHSGIARVLGQQGDKKSLEFLLGALDDADPSREFQQALAVGRLINRYDISGDKQIRVLQQAFEAESYETTRAYLYGWYRGDESRLTSAARDTLFSRWQLQGTGINAEVDQYVNEILTDRTTAQMTIFYNGEQRLDSETQLSVELAKSLGELELNKRNALAAKILLTNANPHVRTQSLRSLKGKLRAGGDLYNYVSGTMVTDTLMEASVWIEALRTAATVEQTLVNKYEHRLQKISEDNPYLLAEVLSVYEENEAAEKYLGRIADLVNGQDQLRTMHALQSLNRFWSGIAEDGEVSEYRERVRALVFQALQQRDRGVAYMAQSLLGHSQLFGSDDFKRINSVLHSFTLPGDIEVYQAFGRLYKDRFERQARGVVDSLAALGYIPLNRSLAEAGWAVDVPEDSERDFRMPDWQRLWELGRTPVWTLRTGEGEIEIELNTLQAPATVAMIDSLSRAGHYDGVPFHRVVPNFVIQGGDIERADGFGGPDFVIPTEASEGAFERGGVGIASAGTDTEGSQYFIMHQWKPHLNGNYTLFGRVVDGMEVVDRITVGDRVLSTTWY